MNFFIYGIALAVIFPFTSLAQSTCHQPTAGELKVVTLVDVNMGLEELPLGSYGPVQMAIAPDGRVFVGKMKTGEIRVYTPNATNPQPATLVGTIPTWMGVEDGLLGIALDPKFSTNHWLYAFYSDPCGENCTNRAMELGRYTITGSQLSNKKVILRFPRSKDDHHHAAGGLAFDDQGVLVIGTGDNTDPADGVNAGFGPFNSLRTAADAQMTSANSNDLRGKILRIKPLAFADNQTPVPGLTTTYDVPTGNLWEKMNDNTFNPGWDNKDTLRLVRKEIFTMGHRNPYHVRVDSKSGWIFWGEVGPDADAESSTRGPTGHDEWNLATGPGFFGHPYCNGYNVPYNMMVTANPPTYGAKYNCAATVNNSPNNTGVHHLPPAVPALVAYASGNSTDDDPRFNVGTDWTKIVHAPETAVGGPMYRYDPKLVSPIKFPPYYEGKVLFFDWIRKNFRFITLNQNGTIPTGVAGVENFAVTGLPSGSYIDMQYGPDGAMYLLKFSDAGYTIGSGPQLFRVEYTGIQDSACYRQFVPTVGPTALKSYPTQRPTLTPNIDNGAFTLPQGYRSMDLFDLSGKRVWSYSRSSTETSLSVRLPQELAHGLWQVKVAR